MFMNVLIVFINMHNGNSRNSILLLLCCDKYRNLNLESKKTVLTVKYGQTKSNQMAVILLLPYSQMPTFTRTSGQFFILQLHFWSVIQ